ncbi:MAG: hypothetical protein Q8R04_05385 [Nanoarchaeota archaeon]|nr:hypothetical protein [Nanoarchaeota archaeon]
MALEKLMQGRTISVRSFDEFVELCSANNDKPRLLVAVQLPASELWKGSEKFVAFFVNGLRKDHQAGVVPLTTGYVFDALVKDGRIEYLGDSTSPLNHYPVSINEADFNDGKIVVLNPASDLGMYVAESLDGGRLRAIRKLYQAGVPLSFLERVPDNQ